MAVAGGRILFPMADLIRLTCAVIALFHWPDWLRGGVNYMHGSRGFFSLVFIVAVGVREGWR